MLTCSDCPTEISVASVVEAIGLGWRLGPDGRWRCPHCVWERDQDKQKVGAGFP